MFGANIGVPLVGAVAFVVGTLGAKFGVVVWRSDPSRGGAGAGVFEGGASISNSAGSNPPLSFLMYRLGRCEFPDICEEQKFN
jgi:hypothetical protein